MVKTIDVENIRVRVDPNDSGRILMDVIAKPPPGRTAVGSPRFMELFARGFVTDKVTEAPALGRLHELMRGMFSSWTTAQSEALRAEIGRQIAAKGANEK